MRCIKKDARRPSLSVQRKFGNWKITVFGINAVVTLGRAFTIVKNNFKFRLAVDICLNLNGNCDSTLLLEVAGSCWPIYQNDH
jgi:hypothetical protein